MLSSLLVALFASSVAAAEPHEGHLHPSPILEDLESGAIDRGEALWLTYLQHFEPDALPPEYADAELDAGFVCSTGLLQELVESWEDFTPAQREQMTATLAPWKDDLLDPNPQVDGPPPPAASAPCLVYGQNEVRGDHFSVQWDSAATQTQAENFLTSLEYSWGVLFDELGWWEPEGSNQYLITAYIGSGGASAYTTVDYCGGRYMPYIVAGNGSFSAGTWYQDMAGHELMHASQFAYGWAFEFWWWEASATWVEDDIYTGHKAWSDYIWGYSMYPHTAMNASSQSDQSVFYHMYGMAIWGFYMEEYVDANFVQDSWEYAADKQGVYDLGMVKTVEKLGYDFDTVYAGFMAANTVMDYEDQKYFPPITRTASVTELPKSGENKKKSSPEYLGQNYIWIDADLATAETPDLTLNFAGKTGAGWIAMLVGALDKEVAHIARVELTVGDYEAGSVTLADFGQYDEVWMVVSPTEDISDMNYVYDLEATAPAVEETAEGGGEGGEDGFLAGCGCSAASPQSGGAWGLLILAIGAAMRRRA